MPAALGAFHTPHLDLKISKPTWHMAHGACGGELLNEKMVKQLNSQ
jgi:hypothetical protein